MIPKLNCKETDREKLGDVTQRTLMFPKCFGLKKASYTKLFEERMQALGYTLSDNGETIIFQETETEEQGYILKISPEVITIKAKDEEGFFYGLTSIFQMVAEGEGQLSCGEYFDSPRFSYRGIMLDVCRHFFTVEEVEKIIDQMSFLKLNKFHWHLSNDQAYRIESKCFPKLNEISSYRKVDELDPLVEKGLISAGEEYGGYYTEEEINEVIAYAKERYIEVIPEIEMPGHATAILSAFPEAGCSGEAIEVASTFGIHEKVFCVGKQENYNFLTKLLDEVCSLFESRYLHLGGDEVSKTEWKKCPACARVMKEQGFTSYENLQSHFMNQVIAHIKKKGKIPIVWNESVVDGKLDSSAVVQYWMEMAPGESYIPKEISQGRKFILSNQTPFYSDYSYAETPLRATLHFMPQAKGNPIPEKNVLGIEAPMWTEWTISNEEIERMMYPRMLAVAECGWTKERETTDFLERAKKYLELPVLNILKPMPWDEANISGEEALKMIAAKMLELSGRHAKMAAKEGRKVHASVHEEIPQVDPAVQVYQYMKSKMDAAYSDEDVKRVLYLISELRG